MTKEELISDRDLERCTFDDECDHCEMPEGGTWVKMLYGWETEADYYICGNCIETFAETAERWKEL